MIMSEFEIYRSMKHASNQNTQADILSELNSVPKKKIIAIYKNYDKNLRKSDREYNKLLKKAKKNIPSQAKAARASFTLAALI